MQAFQIYIILESAFCSIKIF